MEDYENLYYSDTCGFLFLSYVRCGRTVAYPRGFEPAARLLLLAGATLALSPSPFCSQTLNTVVFPGHLSR